MSYAACIRAITKAAGRTLTDDEIVAIYQRVHDAARDIKAGRKTQAEVTAGKKVEAIGGQASNDLVRAAAQKAALDYIAEANQVRQQAALQILKTTSRLDAYKAVREAGVPPLKALDMIVFRNFKGKVSVTSLEQHATGVKDMYLARVLKTWEALGDEWLGFFQDRTKQIELLKALRGDPVSDPLATQGAKPYAETSEAMRLHFNEAGGHIGKLENWGFPQHHSQVKAADSAFVMTGTRSADPEVNKKAWVDWKMGLVDRAKYVDALGNRLSDPDIREFLGHAWETVSTNGIANLKPGEMHGIGKKANRHSEHRSIHYKDAESAIKDWEKFGEKSIIDILHGHVESMARDIAMIEFMGPNDKVTWNTLRDTALKEAVLENRLKTDELKMEAEALDRHYDHATGRTRGAANATIAGISDGIAHLNTAAKGGGFAVASLFGDRAMYQAVAHMNNVPKIADWRAQLSLLNPANKADRALLRSNGLMLEGIKSGLQRFWDDFGTGSTFSNVTGKWANLVMRITGMSAINTIPKGAFEMGLGGVIGEEIRAGRKFSELPDSDIRTLRNYGITEADWNVWSKAPLSKVNVYDNVLLSEGIGKVSDVDALAADHARVTFTRNAYDSQIAKLQERTAKTQGAMAKRDKAFADFQDRVNRAVKQYAANKTADAAKTVGDLGMTVEKIFADLDDVRTEAKENAASMRDDFDAATEKSQRVGEMRAKAKELARDATEAINARASDAKDRVEAYRKTLTEFADEITPLAKGRKVTDREGGWVEARRDKFADIQDRINRTVKEFAAEQTELNLERVGEIQSRVDDLLGDLGILRGDVVENLRESIEALDETATSGREVGRLKERALTKAREAQKAINERADDARERIEALRDDLGEARDSALAGMKRRQAVIDRLAKERDQALAALPDRIRRDATVKFLGAINTEAEFAIVTPGWKERAQFYSNLQKGTVGGTFGRQVLQFKSFPWTFFQRSLDAIGNMESGGSKVAMGVYLLLAQSATGAMIIQVREMLAGKDPLPMNDRDWYKFWGKAFLQGGALGIYGDLLYSVNQTRYGSGPLEALAGPTLGPMLEMGLVQPLNAAKAHIEGKPTHLAAQMIRDVKGFTPGQNIWWAKPALDNMLWSAAMEAASPGYMGRVRAREMKEWRQDRWWLPATMGPERLPDLGAAIR